ncbi:lactate permease [Saccharopolyspora phatthalungensis]|uniref:L-lactate permease n=1 Tax=Saccharopolyspora phatthalungensis TaxID=664693 RepID=A0A840QA11_9PSEU|nr:lactate permease [Saccharopolyspora phatthalungensis]
MTLFVLLGVFRVKAPVAAVATLGLSMALAVLGWQMPLGQAASAAFYGALYGLFPILWILINAVWIYKMTEVTGWFPVLGRKIRAVSDDTRVQAILIAFCFGALMEALAGFGAPVAISAVMLMAVGLRPVKAAVVALVANTAPVAFGSMGVPITTLASVTGLPLETLGQMAGRQTPLIAAFIPLVLVYLVDGRRGVRQTWPVALVAGFAFAASQFITANYVSVEITDIVAGTVTIAVVLGFLRMWQPAEDTLATHAPRVPSVVGSASADTRGTSDGDTTFDEAPEKPERGSGTSDTSGSTIMATAPYLIIIGLFAIKQSGPVKQWLIDIGTFKFNWPGLHLVSAGGQPIATEFTLEHINGTGTFLLFAGLLTMLVYRVGLSRAVRCYADTLVQLRWTIVTVTSVLGLAFVMNFSGQTASLGAAMASAGGLFALLSPVVGWFGVAVTGSDTSSNSLFGALQVAAAQKTGLSPVLLAAANSSAGVLGKMISAQNLAVAAAAIDRPGAEPEIFRKVIGWSLGLLAVSSVLIYLQSTQVLGWMVP